jgi:acetyltransferase-like isoleucine patch superfamily enzyme
LWYGKIPKMIFLGKGVRFFNGSNIEFGRWVQLEDQVFLGALGKEKLTIGHNVRIGAFSRIIISISFNDLGTFIRIGNNVGIGEYAHLGGAGGLSIGDNCIIGPYLSCHPENHVFEKEGLIRMQGVTRKGIDIGKNCWIGAKVTILDGVKIGDNCVIAAGAVVTKSMPPNSVIGGVPAKVIRRISSGKFMQAY